MRTNISINGIMLTPEQIQCLREVMLINYASNSDILREPDGNDMTAFYRYREFANNWLDLIDNNPFVKVQSHALPPGFTHVAGTEEPVVYVDDVRMNFLLCMQVRMAMSCVGFNLEDVDALIEEGIPMGELAKLQKIVGSIYKQDNLPE